MSTALSRCRRSFDKLSYGSATSNNSEGKLVAANNGNHSNQTNNHAQSILGADDETSHEIRIAVLGAKGVGKTSICKQFMNNEFNSTYKPTGKVSSYRPSFMIGDKIYEVRIIDCPPISFFPNSTLCEWSEFRGYGLRTASAYLLVYDVTDNSSFKFIKHLREQIISSQSQCQKPIFVMRNKLDLVLNTLQTTSTTTGSITIPNYSVKASILATTPVRRTTSSAQQTMFSVLTSAVEERRSGHGTHGGGLMKRGERCHDSSLVVKKLWKCGHVDCSAKCNWHVVRGFQELMKTIHTIDLTANTNRVSTPSLLCANCNIQ